MWRIFLIISLALFFSGCSLRFFAPAPPVMCEGESELSNLASWANYLAGFGVLLSVVSLAFTQGASVKWSVKILLTSLALLIGASILGFLGDHTWVMLCLSSVAVCSLLVWYFYRKSTRVRSVVQQVEAKIENATGIDMPNIGGEDGSA